MSWEPQFKIVKDNPLEAAEAISAAHGDDGINRMWDTSVWLHDLKGSYTLTSFDLKSIHGKLFWDLTPSSQIGCWRTRDVSIGGNIATDPLLLDHAMRELPDINHKMSGWSMMKWYWKFQEIHPFYDGNGRIGGIALAVISYSALGFYIVPDEV